MTDNLKDKIKQALKENSTDKPQKKSRDGRTPLVIIFVLILVIGAAALIIAGMRHSSSVFSTSTISAGQAAISADSSTKPYGKLFSPTTGSRTGRKVNVSGETRNLDVGQYVWLAVDKPDIGLCWPKAGRIKLNTKFMTTIYEGGPQGHYTLSLYAVNKLINDQWQEWLDHKIFGGLPMPPDKRRLDAVILTLDK